VQTLWFEDGVFWHEQMLDTPLGRFSVRQMGMFLVFGLLAWTVSLAFSDLVLKIVAAGAIFFAGTALFRTKRLRRELTRPANLHNHQYPLQHKPNHPLHQAWTHQQDP
jgi:hypothetical protein